MTVASTSFSPQMLNNVQNLKTLFSGEEELHALDQLPKEAYIRPAGQLYMSRWYVGWIFVTAPLRIVFYVFLKSIAGFLDCFFMRFLSRRLHLQAHHLAYPVDIAWNQLSYGKRLLSPSLNDYRKDISDVYTLKNIPRAEILDTTIRKKLHAEFDKVPFDLFGKLCNGSVYWFNYLLLKSGNDSYAEKARALATFFKDGQPRQAALLQALYGLQTDLVGIEEETFEFYPSHFTSEKLSDGIYHLALPKHSVSYIKWKNEEFVMDPEVGLIKIEEPQHLKDIIEEYTKYHEGEPIFFALQSLKRKNFIFSAA